MILTYITVCRLSVSLLVSIFCDLSQKKHMQYLRYRCRYVVISCYFLPIL
ncbi:hypothetical protein ACHAXS_005669 [Conticribra weissflogii]